MAPASHRPLAAAPSAPAAQHFCNLCRQHTHREKLYQVAGYDILRCSSCRLTFVPLSPPLAETVAGVYSEEYFEGGREDGYTDYSSSESVLRHQAQRTLKRLRRYQSSGPLLELGCAYGFFLLEARKYFECSGIELSAFAAAQARKRGLDVRAGDFQQLEFPASHYSAVCLFDCIEHLADPFSYLGKIHSVLRPGGVMALTTGDIGSLYARISGRRWRLMTPPQHLFYFSRRTLTAMLERTGFEVVECTYPWKLVPLGLILYQISPRLKAALEPIARLPIGFYVNLFDAMFILARKPL